MGRLGKPQKSKKHKKMKKTFDPEMAFEGDFSSGRNKMQNLPVKEEDLDRQDIPRKLKDIIHSKNNPSQVVEKKKKNKQKKKKLMKAAESTLMNAGAKKKLKPIPRFVQGKNEKDSAFIRRVEIETNKVVMQSQMEKKYKIKFDTIGSNASLHDELKKKSSKRKKQKDKERKKKKVEIKKEKKRERAGDFSSFKDDVAFGEVAMAPPLLTAKPRKADSDNNDKPRPGKRSLLLKDMMNSKQSNDSETSSNTSESVVKIHPKTQAQRLAGQTIKRKYLSPVQKQITDFQRQNAIYLYRKMKDNKLKKA